MAIDPSPAILRVEAILLGLSGSPTLTAYVGPPAALGGSVNAYIAGDVWTINDKTPGLVEHTVDISVTFAYRTGAGVRAAELAIMTRAGLFYTAMLNERRSNDPGSLRALGWSFPVNYPSFARAADPQYTAIAGQEFRLYPGIVRITAQESY